MRQQIISLDDWWDTPQGRHALAWQQSQFADALADVFGFNAVQLGVPELDGLLTNRMPHKWLVGMHQVADGCVADPSAPTHRACQMVCDPAALPFQANTLDLVVLPHTLEQSAHPHGALREVERVLRPEGR
jgi:SAM-dependent methyltransferase